MLVSTPHASPERILSQPRPPNRLVSTYESRSPPQAGLDVEILSKLVLTTWQSDSPNSHVFRVYLRQLRHRPFDVTDVPYPDAISYLIQPVLDVFNGLLISRYADPLSMVQCGTPTFPTSVALCAIGRCRDAQGDDWDEPGPVSSNRFETIKRCLCVVIFEPEDSLNSSEWILSKDLMYEKSRTTRFPARTWATAVYQHCLQMSCRYAVLTDTKTTILFEISSIGGRDGVLIHYRVVVEDETLSFTIAKTLFSSTRKARIAVNKYRAFGSARRQGAMNNPVLCVPRPLEAVIATVRSTSDLDVYAMQQNPALFEEYTLWKSHIDALGENEPPLVGICLAGTPRGLLDTVLPFRSPLLPPRLPLDTQGRIDFHRRPRCVALDEALSQPFNFEITQIVRSEPETWSQVVFGRVIPHSNITDSLTLPLVCVKLYDERFFATVKYIHDEAWPGEPPLTTYNEAVDLARREKAVYHSMQHVQGSFIPHCYGFHTFTYLSGWQTYGMVCEIVHGVPLDTGTLASLPYDVQRSFATDARHAVRCLRYADIFQTDWTSNDVLCVTNCDEPESPTPVMLDFAFALQSEAGCNAQISCDVENLNGILADAGIPEQLLDDPVVWWPMDEVEY